MDKENKPAQQSKPGTAGSWKRATESQLNVLSSTLQALKRDSMRPSITGQRVSGPQPAAQPRAEPDAQQQQQQQQQQADETGHSLQLLQGDASASPHEGAAFALSAPDQGLGLAHEAAQLFGEEAFLAAFEQVFAFQLQRTRNGATDKSRVVELAGASGPVT